MRTRIALRLTPLLFSFLVSGLGAPLLADATEAPRTPAPPDQKPLITLAERTSDSSKENPYPEASLAEVDVNSAIVVHVNKDAIAVPAGTSDAAAKLRDTLAKTQTLVDALNAAVSRTQAVEQSVGQLNAKSTPDVVAGVARDAEAAAQSLRSLRNQVIAAADAAFGTGKGTAMVRAAEDVSSAIAPSLDVLRTIVDKIQKDYDSLISDQVGKFVIFATVDGRQLHVPGYDTLQDGPVQVFDKLHPVVGPDVAAAYKDASTLASGLNSLKDGKTNLSDTIKSAIAAIEKDLSDSASGVANIQNALKPVLAAKTVSKTVTDFSSALSDCSKVLKTVRTAFNLRPNEDPLDALTALVSGVNNTFGDAQQCIESIGAFGQATEQDLVDVQKNIRSDVQALLGVLNRIVQLAPAAGNVPSSVPQLDIKPIPADAAQDATISLLSTTRTEGDTVIVTAQLTRGTTVFETRRYLKVRLQGFNFGAGAGLALVRSGLTGDPSRPYLFAPMAYAVIRYRGERGQGETGASGFWEFLQPGLGVATMTVPDAAGNNDLAVAGTLQLFGDVLQGGIGGTVKAKTMFFVALGLQQLLNLGKVIPIGQ